MGYLILKALITTVIILAVSEVAKRSTFAGAILASLPLMSILALIWLYQDTRDVTLVRSLAMGIFWMVIPTLLFFILLSVLLKNGMQFYPALLISCVGLIVAYAGYTSILKIFNIRI